MDGRNTSVLIIGGTSGIGLAAAQELTAGYRVTIAGGDPERLASALDGLNNPEAQGHVADAGDRASLETCIAALDRSIT